MFTFLDLLIVVSLALIAGGLLALALMFLLRNKTAQRICFYIAVALSVYIGYVGIRINRLEFFSQTVLAGLFALVSIGALVLERLKKDNDKLFLVARIAAAAALVLGTVNALLI